MYVLGHISLVVPVVHIWYFKSLPSKIGYLLGIPSKKLEAIIYYERYVVINAGAAAEQGITKLQTLAEKEYLDVLDALPKGNQSFPNDDPNKFVAMMGAEAIKVLLQEVDLDTMSFDLRDRASKETSQQRKSEILKQLNVIESFRASNGKNKPEWMVLDVIPVIRNIGSERPLSSCHNPQQPSQTPYRNQGSGGDSPQREAYVAGGCRFAVRQLA